MTDIPEAIMQRAERTVSALSPECDDKKDAQTIALAIMTERDRALEEAAKACEGNFDSEMTSYGNYFATAIRTMKGTAP